MFLFLNIWVESKCAVFCLQWDLVCDRAYLKDLTQTIFTFGVMLGAMSCTTVSDKFGRKPVFLFSQWAMVVVGVANAFAPNYYVFAVFRFLTGALQQVRLPACRIYCCFWATVCRTVRPMLSDHCLSCLSCLWRWSIVAKPLDGSRCHLVWR